jgi:hypothetical protein
MKQVQVASSEAIGKTYGRLFVLDIFYYIDSYAAYAKCECECGNKCEVRVTSLRNGRTRSCGCLMLEVAKIIGKKCSTKFKKTHGESNSTEGHIWYGMMQRCYDKNCKAFKNYGGRGIEVYKPWRSKKNGLRRFVRWLLSDVGIGRRPSGRYSIDRINNDGNYVPGNLKWSTNKEQIHNRRSSFNKKDKLTIFLVLKDIKHIRQLTKNESKIYYKLKKDAKLN